MAILRLAVIGCGPSGISLAVNLLPKIIPFVGCRVEVEMFDRMPRAICGGAFGVGPQIHVCNQRSISMGPSNPTEFYDWLRCRYPSLPDSEYLIHPPRQDFGIFMAQKLESTREQFHKYGHRLTITAANVVEVNDRKDGVTLTTQEGEELEFNSAVLAIGLTHSDKYTELIGSPNYFESPYPTYRLADKIPQTARVAILGTSLTAIDAANGLVELGHAGPILLCSRTGGVPSVLTKGETYEPVIFNDESVSKLLASPPVQLSSVIPMILEEAQAATSFSNFNLDCLPGEDEPALEFLTRSFHSSQIVQPYQSVLRAVYAKYGEAIYRHLSPEERRLAKDSSLWKRFRHTMARPTAKAFIQLLGSGQANVIGGLKSVSPTGSGFRIEYGVGHIVRDLKADFLINATGVSSNISRAFQSGQAPHVLRSLVASGQVSVHPVDGLNASYDRWNSIRRDGTVSKRLYVTGHLLSGPCFYVSGMDAISRLTNQLTQSIVEDWAELLRMRLCERPDLPIGSSLGIAYS